MRVFGCDIGCKNLAYCIFEVNDGRITIQNWDLVDLRSCICCRTLRNGKQCNKTATYYEGDKLYCTSHKGVKCKKIKDTDNFNVYASKIKEYFSKIDIECDMYGLENQPSLKNPTMKSIQMLLFGFLSYYKLNSNPIELIHPKMKLSILEKETNKIIKNSSNKYKTTKELGIIITRYLIEKEVDDKDKWLELLDDKTKCDDLCDAFLHAYYLVYGKNYKVDDKELIDLLQ